MWPSENKSPHYVSLQKTDRLKASPVFEILGKSCYKHETGKPSITELIGIVLMGLQVFGLSRNKCQIRGS